MNQSRKITDGALLTATFIILMLITLFVPGISLITIFVLPVPFIFYSYKNDWQASLMMLGVSVILSIIFATIVSLPLVMFVGIGGIMIGTAMHHQLSAYETWARGTVGFIIGFLLVIVFTQIVLGVNLASEIEQMINESFEISQGIMEELGILSPRGEDWEIVKQQLTIMKSLIPVGITITSIVYAFISQWLGYRLLNRLEGEKLFFPKFREMRLPKAIIWIYLLAMLFMFVELDPNGMIHLIAYNTFSLVGMFLVLQGFSFMFYIAYRNKQSKYLPIIGVILALILPHIFLYFIRVLGIIDIGFGLRDSQLTNKE